MNRFPEKMKPPEKHLQPRRHFMLTFPPALEYDAAIVQGGIAPQ